MKYQGYAEIAPMLLRGIRSRVEIVSITAVTFGAIWLFRLTMEKYTSRSVISRARMIVHRQSPLSRRTFKHGCSFRGDESGLIGSSALMNLGDAKCVL